MSYSSNGGLSMKADGTTDVPTAADPKPTKASFSEEGEECFYNLCIKQPCCGGKVTCGRFKSRNHSFFCWVFGIMLTSLILSVVVPLVLYKLADSSIDEAVVIDSTSASSYESWQTNAFGSGKDDVEVTYSLYYFDLQNHEAVVKGAKPIVVELGPYVFNEYYNKFDIVWTDGGDTVTYNTQKYYIFDQEKSGPGLTAEDEIMLPYPTLIGFQYLLGTIPPEQQQDIADTIDDDIMAIEGAILYELDGAIANITANRLIPPATKTTLLNELSLLEYEVEKYFGNLLEFTDQSSPTLLLLKTLLCKVGFSPFKKNNPVNAWFGWLNDSLLIEVVNLLDASCAKTGNCTAFSSAVPGAATNWTSVADTRRRRSPDTFKTGKNNKNQIAQYVAYENMQNLYTCIDPMKSQNTSEYKEGYEFPACALFQPGWTEDDAKDMGYTVPWATPYATRIEGSDANMFGRPVRSDRLQVFISDIYRSVYLLFYEEVEWYGVKARRYSIQTKDLYNATTNPENSQYYNNAPSGMLNTTKAVNIPVFVSFPHFLDGDERLVAAISGLHPDEATHLSYLDVEPQTGLLVRAKKRLQVNYQMTPLTYPTTPPDALANGQMICNNITVLSAALAQVGVIIFPNVTCENGIMGPLLTCLGIPVSYEFQDDGIFFPYGWTSEEVTVPKSTADDLSASLFLIDNVAVATQFWCLIVAGICFAILCAMLIDSYFTSKNVDNSVLPNFQSDTKLTEPLLSASAPWNTGAGTDKGGYSA